MKKIHTRTFVMSNDHNITLETNFLAQQAHGSVTVMMGNSVLLATVVEKKEEKPSPFLPLTVEFRENFASGGVIPGNYFRRESKLSEYEILVSRLIDRSIRPLYVGNFCNSIQVQVTLLSHDKNIDVSNLAVLAASSALSLSSLPFLGPVASVRVGKIAGVLCIDPTPSALADSPINVAISGTENRLLMLEGNTQEINAKELIEIIAFAKEPIQKKCQLQKEFFCEVKGNTPDISHAEAPKTHLEELLHNMLYDHFYAVAKEGIKNKQDRVTAFTSVVEEAIAQLQEEDVAGNEHMIDSYINNIKREAIRNLVINEKRRVDGRKSDEIRPIDIRIDFLPSTHGSAVFTRGSTQVLATVTLGGPLDVQHLDGISLKGSKKFLLHYNFPGFCTGEARPNRGPGRREIGHGHLAEKAIASLLPESPYTIRLTAETLASDGSSSMASVCAGSLALMDAGIQITKQVAGIAMGLIHDEKTGQNIILSDIMAEEDACGNVDFKITGTKDGITACQMDIKDTGISFEILGEMLAQAQAGINHILDKMNTTISSPNKTLKPHAPVIRAFSINPSMMGIVIGPKGKTIQNIQQTTGAVIQITDDGTVTIVASNSQSSDEAYNVIQGLVSEPEVEKIYTGTIKSLTKYGAFVEFMPQKEGLLHVTEMEQGYIEDPSTLFTVGQKIKVRLISITESKDRNGRPKFGLSLREV